MKCDVAALTEQIKTFPDTFHIYIDESYTSFPVPVHKDQQKLEIPAVYFYIFISKVNELFIYVSAFC